jgi:DNA-binding transcriptional ArsR family regulator
MVLVPLLGSPAKEAVLLYVLTHEEAYPSETAAALDRALFVVQNQLSRLEAGGVMVSRLRGKVRLYKLNPRYPFRKELERLLWRGLEFYPADERERLYTPRLRPRRAGKASRWTGKGW